MGRQIADKAQSAGLVSSDCGNKIPKTGWLKEQKLIFSPFWRLEVQDQGASVVGFWWDFSTWFASFVDAGHLSVCSHDLFFGERGSKLSGVSSDKTWFPWAQLPWPHLNVYTPQRPRLQTPSHCGLGLHHMNWQVGGTQFSPWHHAVVLLWQCS